MKRLLLVPLLGFGLAAMLANANVQAQEIDLSRLTCGQVGMIEPEAIQTSIVGLAVGYAMGQAQGPFDLERANDWFAAFRDLCAAAPEAQLSEVIPLIADKAAAGQAQ